MVFVDIDTQVDFVDADANLPVPGAEDIRENLAIMTEYATSPAIDAGVIKTADWHTHETEEIVFDGSEDFETTFPPHCMAGHPGAEFIPETQHDEYGRLNWMGVEDKHEPDRACIVDIFARKLEEGETVVILKDKFDVFEGNPLTSRVIDELDPDHATVYGVAGDVCVAQAVDGLLERGINVTVVRDAIASLDEAPIDEWVDRGVNLAKTSDYGAEQRPLRGYSAPGL